MRIAVLSGKGGTGKTLFSVNLAAVAQSAVYVDCDVEEPNGHLFFKSKSLKTTKVNVKVPQINAETCTGCRKCVDFCQFNALAYLQNKVVVFDAVCHACGGCALICPVNAITQRKKEIGLIQVGISESVLTIGGMIHIGVESGVPLIREVLRQIPENEDFVIIDCPPGSSCSVMESIKDADYCLLVAEPTIFGAHNLEMVLDLVKLFNKPHGVILNKITEGFNPSEAFCHQHNTPIIGRLSYSESLGRLSADGVIAVRQDPILQHYFSDLLYRIQKEVHYEKVTHSER
jgi:MinD superfamily P-loop ATPase